MGSDGCRLTDFDLGETAILGQLAGQHLLGVVALTGHHWHDGDLFGGELVENFRKSRTTLMKRHSHFVEEIHSLDTAGVSAHQGVAGRLSS